MADSEKITAEKIKYIATLSRIGISDAEAEKYAAQMTSILDYMSVLSELDTVGVAMTTQVTGLKNVMRDDDVRQYVDPDALLQCSALPKLNHSVVVKAVIKE